MQDIKCDLCGSSVIEGDYGESKYICQNATCGHSNPRWAAEKRRHKIQPYLEKMESLTIFEAGTIDFYDARWKGDGTAKIILNNCETFMCHVRNEQFEPFDNEDFNEMNIKITKSQIDLVKSNMLELVKLRNELFKL